MSIPKEFSNPVEREGKRTDKQGVLLSDKGTALEGRGPCLASQTPLTMEYFAFNSNEIKYRLHWERVIHNPMNSKIVGNGAQFYPSF